MKLSNIKNNVQISFLSNGNEKKPVTTSELQKKVEDAKLRFERLIEKLSNGQGQLGTHLSSEDLILAYANVLNIHSKNLEKRQKDK